MCTQWKQERTSEPTTCALRFTEMGGRWECNVACRISRPSRSQSSTSARRSCLGAICTAQIAGAGARTWVEASRAHLCSPVRRLRCRSIPAACKVTSLPVVRTSFVGLRLRDDKPRTGRVFFLDVSDQVIRENAASRGTETSAEVLVGPPWRMESNAGQQQWY